MNLRLWKALLYATLALGVVFPAAGQWKWRDKSGQVQYSDLPPPSEIADVDILQRPQPSTLGRTPPASASAPNTSVPLLMPKASDPELEAKRRKVEEEEAAKRKAEEQRVAAAKADNCSRARGHLRALDEGLRIVRTNEKGEREFLDDGARANESKRAREVIAADCK